MTIMPLFSDLKEILKNISIYSYAHHKPVGLEKEQKSR